MVARARQTTRRLRVRSSDRPDPAIAALTLLFVSVGVLMVFDTTYFYSQTYLGDGYMMLGKHGTSIVMGVILLLLMARTRSYHLERWARPALVIALLFVALTLIPGVGSCVKGACRWIRIGPLNFQPAELAKCTFVIYLAAELTRKGEELRDWRKGLLPTLAVVAGLAALFLKQPDFGTTVLIGALSFALMFLAGVPLRHLAACILPLVGAAVVLVQQEPYRLKRFLCFLDPWVEPQGACYQLVQSFRTFASGGITGSGLGSSMQKTGWLPEAHTDFVFAVIGEEGGLVGAIAVLLLFTLFSYRGFRVAHRHPQMFGQLLAAGITLLISLQVLINMGVVLGLLPTKGLVLPFLSYGGSSMMVTLACVGILMSLSRELRER